jgi:hypothetical protein
MGMRQPRRRQAVRSDRVGSRADRHMSQLPNLVATPNKPHTALFDRNIMEREPPMQSLACKVQPVRISRVLVPRGLPLIHWWLDNRMIEVIHDLMFEVVFRKGFAFLKNSEREISSASKHGLAISMICGAPPRSPSSLVFTSSRCRQFSIAWWITPISSRSVTSSTTAKPSCSKLRVGIVDADI